MRSTRLLLEDIQLRTERLIDIARRYSRDQIEADPIVYEATLRNIEIIGEAVKNLPAEFKDTYPEVPWRQIGRTRDVLAHIYFGISEDRIWNIVEVEIPILREKVAEMLSSFPPEPENS